MREGRTGDKRIFPICGSYNPLLVDGIIPTENWKGVKLKFGNYIDASKKICMIGSNTKAITRKEIIMAGKKKATKKVAAKKHNPIAARPGTSEYARLEKLQADEKAKK